MSKPLPPKSITAIKKPNIKAKIKDFFSEYLVEMLYGFMLLFLFYITLTYFSRQDYSFLHYIGLQVVILLIGILHSYGFIKWVPWANRYLSTKAIITTILFMIIGALMVNFSRSTTYIPEVPSHYMLAFVFFLVPWLFMIAFEQFISIPDKVYQGWQYPYGKEVPVIEVIDPIKIKFYIAKQVGDVEYAEFELNVPQKYSLGDFMHYFLHRYNYDKNPKNPIFISKENKADDLYSWLFYSKGINLNKKKILDPQLSFVQLALEENENIVVERYSKEDIKETEMAILPTDSRTDNPEINE